MERKKKKFDVSKDFDLSDTTTDMFACGGLESAGHGMEVGENPATGNEENRGLFLMVFAANAVLMVAMCARLRLGADGAQCSFCGSVVSPD